MTSTPKGEELLLSPDVIRALYRRGLALAPDERAVLEVVTLSGDAVCLCVGNGSEGLVDVECEDERVCEELRELVGIRVRGTQGRGNSSNPSIR